jgi:AcrR family transcriptional regulator
MFTQKGPSTIDRIRTAAMRLVAEKGVAATTVRDLALEAGVSEGALYRHYETKDELIRDIYREEYSAFGQRLRKLHVSEKTVKAKLSAIAHHACQMFDDDPVTYRFLLLAQHDVMRAFPADANSPVAVLREVLESKRSEMRIANSDLGVALLLGLLVQPAASIVSGSLAGPLSRYADEISAACIRTLLK